jgi:hypothetical protein
MRANDLLSRLDQVRHAEDELAEARRRLVAEARAVGASWGQIGRALGISRQAAWERYSDREGTSEPAEGGEGRGHGSCGGEG